MARDEQPGSRPTARRRDVLRTMGAGGALALAGCSGDGGGGSTTTESDSVTFLLSTADSGEYGQVGALEANGFELAVRHLNNGGGYVDHAFDDLSGDGVLGRTVESATEDTENDAETAKSAFTRRLEEDNIRMVTGGVGGGVVNALNDVAAEAGIPYMAGTAPVTTVGGESCAKTTFSEGAHAVSILEGLGPILREEFGASASYHQLSTDAPEGLALQSATARYFNRSSTPDWRAIGQEQVRPGSTGFDDELESIAGKRPDVVVINLFGLDAVNAVEAAKRILDDDVGVVVPQIDDTLGQMLGENVEGIVGTIPWDAGLDSDLTTPYSDEYVTNFGRSAGGEAQAGSGTAHVIYTQTLLYAVAAERAGSFDATAVADELEGMEYDVGLGQQRMRACDHQATRPLPVVRGLSGQVADGNRLEIIRVMREPYRGCDESPAADCSL